MDERREALEDIKRTIAKMFGLGRTSKSKPGPLLENARALYDNIGRELNGRPDDEAEAEPAGEQP
jgi:uncharacterized protein (DUF2225 family)